MIVEYNRNKVLEYAHRWAFKRNPNYFNFDNFGGDCTNFASQCIYAGSNIMNYTPLYGWYYINGNNRTPSWTGVEYLYNFLINNKGMGPLCLEVNVSEIEVGDIIQLSFDKSRFHHSPVVIKVGNPPAIDNILIAAHTDDSYNRPLITYNWYDIRFLHIFGVQK